MNDWMKASIAVVIIIAAMTLAACIINTVSTNNKIKYETELMIAEFEIQGK